MADAYSPRVEDAVEHRPPLRRLDDTTPQLDRAEQQWWEVYGGLEERYCWVQTDWVQQFLRGQYLRDILRGLGPSHSVLELGCGTGWLTFQLARAGAAAVTGVDSSPSQIARAKAAAEDLGLGDRVRLEIGDAGDLTRSTRRFDLVVMHAFLHHLTIAEIREALATAADLLRPGGRLVVLEPMWFPDGRTDESRVLWLMQKLQKLPMGLAHRGIRRVGDPEREVRTQLANRWAGALPFGPSPKEMPFWTEELENFLGERFTIVRRSNELSQSHLVAQEVLIAQLSQPRLWATLLRPIVWLARALDRRLMRIEPPPVTVWIMRLYECVVREGADAGDGRVESR
ncbi:MAG TPA: class I SAM-dependent methyltransferase [Thermoleophilaceae bacterium]|jgi:SAM-dependent methyltransferase